VYTILCTLCVHGKNIQKKYKFHHSCISFCPHHCMCIKCDSRLLEFCRLFRFWRLSTVSPKSTLTLHINNVNKVFSAKLSVRVRVSLSFQFSTYRPHRSHSSSDPFIALSFPFLSLSLRSVFYSHSHCLPFLHTQIFFFVSP